MEECAHEIARDVENSNKVNGVRCIFIYIYIYIYILTYEMHSMRNISGVTKRISIHEM